jgi:hypothetical protein
MLYKSLALGTVALAMSAVLGSAQAMSAMPSPTQAQYQQINTPAAPDAANIAAKFYRGGLSETSQFNSHIQYQATPMMMAGPGCRRHCR